MAESNDIRSNVESMTSQASEKIQQTASATMSKGQELAANAGRRVDEATAALGERAKQTVGSIRERAPHEGMIGAAASRVADSLDKTGNYLQEKGLVGMAEDVTELIRRNPIPAMLVGVGLGFLLAKLIRR